MIAFLNLLAHLILINLIATSSKFFFAVAGELNSHRLDLISTLSLQLNPEQCRGDRESNEGEQTRSCWVSFLNPTYKIGDRTQMIKMVCFATTHPTRSAAVKLGRGSQEPTDA
jgi:hypothetical protein